MDPGRDGRQRRVISDGRGGRRGVGGDTPVSGGLLSEREHQPQKENTESVTGVWGGQDAREYEVSFGTCWTGDVTAHSPRKRNARGPGIRRIGTG